MDRNHPLKNVLQKENWESINKAPERMNTNIDNSLESLKEKKVVTGEKPDCNQMQHKLQKMSESIDALERIMNNKIKNQNELVEEIIAKVNKLVQNNNDFEVKLNKLDSNMRNINVAPKQNTSNQKIDAPRGMNNSNCKNTSTMENEVDVNAVSIENIFNCSNKKFD